MKKKLFEPVEPKYLRQGDIIVIPWDDLKKHFTIEQLSRKGLSTQGHSAKNNYEVIKEYMNDPHYPYKQEDKQRPTVLYVSATRCLPRYNQREAVQDKYSSLLGNLIAGATTQVNDIKTIDAAYVLPIPDAAMDYTKLHILCNVWYIEHRKGVCEALREAGWDGNVIPFIKDDSITEDVLQYYMPSEYDRGDVPFIAPAGVDAGSYLDETKVPYMPDDCELALNPNKKLGAQEIDDNIIHNSSRSTYTKYNALFRQDMVQYCGFHNPRIDMSRTFLEWYQKQGVLILRPTPDWEAAMNRFVAKFLVDIYPYRLLTNLNALRVISERFEKNIKAVEFSAKAAMRVAKKTKQSKRDKDILSLGGLR